MTKWTGAWDVAVDSVPGFEFNPRTSKAYAEGREGVLANGHLLGSDADIAYKAGANFSADPGSKFETAIE